MVKKSWEADALSKNGVSIIDGSPATATEKNDEGGDDGVKAATEVILSSVTWGRNVNTSWLRDACCIFMFTVPPFFTILGYIALEHFDGSISRAVLDLLATGFTPFMRRYAPAFDWTATLGYITWVIFQAILYTILPGRSTGQLTPAGHLLEYRTNGLLACILTVILATALCYFDVVDPCIIADHWPGLLVTFNIYGYLLTIIAYIKAHIASSHADDRKFSGSPLYDLLMGIEFNPRFSLTWDWKLFHNGRPGITGWLLTNASFTLSQHRNFGTITPSLLLLNLLQATYILDFFAHEPWYLRTIDISHDHFGFYLAWGSAAFLPSMYTLQAQYLARYPAEDLPPVALACIAAVGIGGYALFRSANAQKDTFRRARGNCTVFGRTPTYIEAPYRTADGRAHTALLLTSGWWGVARHANYTGDLLLSGAMCATCWNGWEGHVLPWFYAGFMTCILVHRCWRDERRCGEKYGAVWGEYCRLVRWRLVPGVW